MFALHMCRVYNQSLKSIYQPNFSVVSRISAVFLDLYTNIRLIWISAEFFISQSKFLKNTAEWSGFNVALAHSSISVVYIRHTDLEANL